MGNGSSFGVGTSGFGCAMGPRSLIGSAVSSDAGTERDRAYTTILSVMQALERKGFGPAYPAGAGRHYQLESAAQESGRRTIDEVCCATHSG